MNSILSEIETRIQGGQIDLDLGLRSGHAILSNGESGKRIAGVVEVRGFPRLVSESSRSRVHILAVSEKVTLKI